MMIIPWWLFHDDYLMMIVSRKYPKEYPYFLFRQNVIKTIFCSVYGGNIREISSTLIYQFYQKCKHNDYRYFKFD